MDIGEIVGLIIFFLLFLGPALRKKKQKREQAKKEEPLAEIEVKRILNKMLGQPKEEEKPSPPIEKKEVVPEPFSKVAKRQFISGVETYEEEGGIEGRQFRSEIAQKTGEGLLNTRFRQEQDTAYRLYKEEPSLIQEVFATPGIARQMIILSEVLNKPLALRE